MVLPKVGNKLKRLMGTQAASKLITPIKLENITRQNIPKAISLSLSSIDPCFDFFLCSSTSNSFHFKPLAFFSKTLVRLEILNIFYNSGITLSSSNEKQTLYTWLGNSINIMYSFIVRHISISLKEKHLYLGSQQLIRDLNVKFNSFIFIISSSLL